MENEQRNKVTETMRKRLEEFAKTSDSFFKIAFAYNAAFGVDDLMAEFSELVWGIKKESKE